MAELKELRVALENSLVWGYDDVTDTNYINCEETTKNLIANGVTIPVRCRDCEYYQKNKYDPEGAMWCKSWSDWLPTEPDDFCSYGKRRNDG